jgi:hypothetical protein
MIYGAPREWLNCERIVSPERISNLVSRVVLSFALGTYMSSDARVQMQAPLLVSHGASGSFKSALFTFSPFASYFKQKLADVRARQLCK